MFIILKRTKRLGITLPDSLCGLFLIALGLGFYLQTNQMINRRLVINRQRLVEVRQKYEHLTSNESKK